MGYLHIGELCERTGVSRRSLRYYEQHGLLDAVRTPAGWRAYEESAVDRVRAVRELLDAGMTVDDLQQVAHCLDVGDRDDLSGCPDADRAVALYEARLGVLEARLAVLAGHRDRLSERIERLRRRAGLGARS